jgi:preprotein translocase subunit SecG
LIDDSSRNKSGIKVELLKTLMIVLQVLSAIGVIGLVLVQQGKGADAGAAFGSGASGTVFGATGSANFLSRTTAWLATVFVVCTIVLAFVVSPASTRVDAGVNLDGVKVETAPTEPVVPATPSNTKGIPQ